MAAVVVVLAALASTTAMAPAQARPAKSVPGPVPHQHGFDMLVSPPRLYFAARRATKTRQLEIENRGSVRLRVTVRLENMAQGRDGSTLLKPSAPYSAARWIRVIPRHFVVKPRTRRFVKVRFRLPRHPEPGDHNVAIILLTPPRKGHGNIHIAGGVGIPTVITVPGPVTDHVDVSSLTTPGFAIGGPVRITATVRESGDVHHSFRGAHNHLTARVNGATVSFPPITVLRDSTVTMTATWTDPPAFCICHMTTAVTSDGRRSVATATIVMFPVVQVLIGLGVLLALAVAFLLLRRYQRDRLASAYRAGLGARGFDPRAGAG